jgi:hypothetical protein
VFVEEAKGEAVACAIACAGGREGGRVAGQQATSCNGLIASSTLIFRDGQKGLTVSSPKGQEQTDRERPAATNSCLSRGSKRRRRMREEIIHSVFSAAVDIVVGDN